MRFSEMARRVANFTASATATILSIIVTLGWMLLGPPMHFSDSWQLLMSSISGVITFIMVFVLNNAQKRDTEAINAKLDALIFANRNIDNKLINLENDTDEEVSRIRQELKNQK